MNLHIMNQNKFCDQFISFLNTNDVSTASNYFFIVQQDGSIVVQIKGKHKTLRYSIYQYLYCAFLILYCKNIILHGLFSLKANIFFLMVPKLKKRIAWSVIGADLHDEYYAKNTLNDRIRKIVKATCVKKITHIITIFKSDVKKAEKKYNTTFIHLPCLTYPSNMLFCKKSSVQTIKDYPKDNISVLAGNSADETNNHYDLLNLILSKIRFVTYEISCPISYGGTEASKNAIVSVGTELFQNKIKFLTEFLPYDEYLKKLNNFDIIIFYHKRPQALGTVIQSLGLGKTLYLNSESPISELLSELGFNFFYLDKCNEIQILQKKDSLHNINLAWKLFTPENTINRLNSFLI